MKYIYKSTYYLLIFALTFFLSLIIYNYFIQNINIKLILSILTSIITIITIALINKRKNYQLNLNNLDQKQLENLKEFLLLSSNKECLDFVKINFKLNVKDILFEKYMIDKYNNIHITFFDTEKISMENFLNVFKQFSDKYATLKLYCFDYNNDLNIFLDKYNLKDKIEIYNIFSIYDIIKKEQNNYTCKYTKIQDKAITIKAIRENLLNPNNWKKFILFGFILLWYSFINKYKIYFIVSAAIFWIFAIICLSKKILKK